MLKDSAADAPDAVVVTAPFSPFDSGPPAGPAVLRGAAAARGLNLRCVDLNIRYLLAFGADLPESASVFVGDHAKNRHRVAAARCHFVEACPLPQLETSRVPCCLHPSFCLPHTFSEIAATVRKMEQDRFWVEFGERHLFGLVPAPPVLGFSIMGPAQVLASCLIASLARRYWPETLIVVGGSHITLLATKIARDAGYGQFFDLFLPGHCEQIFAELMARIGGKDEVWCPGGVITAGAGMPELNELLSPEWPAPQFERGELSLYSHRHISLPLQLSRGCAYGRCSMCTYPAVEAYRRAPHGEDLRRIIGSVADFGVGRISFKDSLLDARTLCAVAEAIRNLPTPVQWSATTKLSASMDEAMMRQLYAAGCRTLEVGVETIHSRLQALAEKRQGRRMMEKAIEATLKAGIGVVVNLIYGFPSETLDEASDQLAWYLELRKTFPELVMGSHNMLEINLGSKFAQEPGRFGLELGPLGPWAFSYPWNAPSWRSSFAERLANAG
ncbi:MAG: radical SAM protein [Sulfuritalea sp.]|nr:radical SAM protein [Sulfuritalea sp.]